MNAIKKFAMMALLVAAPVLASASGDAVHLDVAPIDMQDKVSMQRGAKLFTSYCLSCHSASYMRYNRLTDLGWTEAQIMKEIILPEGAKVGSTMPAAMDKESAKQVYGVAPPDLSVIARSRSADWLYTYLRSFYVDSKRPSGWNNAVFPNVGMPHVLAELQGEQELKDGHLHLAKPGTMKPEEFNKAAADLTAYLVFMGEPAKLVRYDLGKIVVGFLCFLFVLVFALKKEIWKDIK